jgi:nicotinate-nucleotide pyrophosphorylase (carboxylating)
MTYDEQLVQLLEAALREDIGAGDHSTLACISREARGRAVLKIKEDGILAGMQVAARIFTLREPTSVFSPLKEDGREMTGGERAFEVESTVHCILQCERVVLNCMQRMSGIATLTRAYVRRLEGYHTRLLDTRKTTPNFRLLEKEAVRIGGAVNHRFGLFDMIMLKDNHIDYCGGIEKAIDKAYEYVQLREPSLKIEVETRTLEDVDRAVKAGHGKIHRIMLDNFEPAAIPAALDLVAGEFETEASGGINLDNIEEYAKTRVDFVSVGALIHQARSLDLSLKAVKQ